MKISVIVTAYNHEKYIAQCLESVLKQKGDFQVEVITGDDFSTDNTRKIIAEFHERYPKIVSVLPTEMNLGITKNLKQCLDACSGDYIAICEGDDYWTDEYKLQKQMTFLETHQDFSMCFSALMIYYEDLNAFEPFRSQQLLSKDILSTEDLIPENIIGNFSCCMYRTSVVRKFPDELFNLFTVDWMFNMVCGEFGKIGFIRDWMTVYRKHAHGAWAGRTNLENLTELARLIDEYNLFFDYKYNEPFMKKKEQINNALTNAQALASAGGNIESESIDDDMLRLKIRALQREATETQQKAQMLSSLVAKREQEIYRLSTQLIEKESLIKTLYQSTSWKLTRPIRDTKTLVTKGLAIIRTIVWQMGAGIFHILPIAATKKQLLKDAFFLRFGFILKLSHIHSASLESLAKTGIEKTEALSVSKEREGISPYPIIRTAEIKKFIEQNSTPENIVIPENTGTAKVSVVVISYNQEQYIADCLQGIFAQKGNFEIELVIGDDCSTDTTMKIIQNYVDNFRSNRVQAKIISAEKNVGMTKNLQRCLNACTGDYIAVCEGDDYWIDCNKLQKQVNYLSLHPECSLCFHHIYLYQQNSDEFTAFDLQNQLNADIISTKDLILNYYIGNLSCCMYNARHMQKIPQNLFDLYIGDWMFNIYYSQFGDIGRLKDIMSVYRKHDQGAWAGKDQFDRLIELHTYVAEYNKFLNYKYDAEFSLKLKEIEAAYPDGFHKAPVEIAIIDDVFPHPLSAFRMQEFVSYLKEFENLKIYSSGLSVHILGTKSLPELFADFKSNHPKYADNIEVFKPGSIIKAKLFYMVFLGNTFTNIDLIEQLQIPFVFTLYPGGMFGLNNSWSDTMLKRVTSSPCFRKVIVTQKVTYDYLIEKHFCTPDQIEFIFGVVTPLEKIEAEYAGKSHFGIDKDTLDICFSAHKYTEKGIDKGYDIFIEVARELCKRYDNIRFHVVGGFDENVIDISAIEDKIAFYGKREMAWFDEFYKDKDIILSPNIPYMLIDGAFDGFPTGSCVDAGVRKTALFCTDELKLNTQFIDGEEIVIIPHNASQIVGMIENYYKNPQKLKTLAENGCHKIKEVYSFEAQILPRIDILKKELAQAAESKKTIGKLLEKRMSFRQRLGRWMTHILVNAKRITPPWFKGPLRRVYQAIRSNEALFSLIKRVTPEFVIRIYSKLKSS